MTKPNQTFTNIETRHYFSELINAILRLLVKLSSTSNILSKRTIIPTSIQIHGPLYPCVWWHFQQPATSKAMRWLALPTTSKEQGANEAQHQHQRAKNNEA
ncbi:hypothetical protein O6H91_12G104100 [Diphasiastrum complanatum]|uniref:Uncharacterized protein n=1 Tax=Diphasiastrum complanatum TaxID=34168 RepID=A0ACC2C5R8_DIPCM|nr:hypothetical protein O6H91_12G104100 [Diphasiastrum complanatum]